MGGAGGINEGGDLMSLTPKCNIFGKSLRRPDRKCRTSWKCRNSRKSRVSRKVGKSKKIRESRKSRERRKGPNGSKWVQMTPNG